MTALPDLIEIKGTEADGWRVRVRSGLTHCEFDCATLAESLATAGRVFGEVIPAAERGELDLKYRQPADGLPRFRVPS